MINNNLIPPKPSNVTWTDEQWRAIFLTGQNILVSAGAGSGKTAVLTERLTRKILNGTSLNELIVLTFTKDAASTMKERLRKSLQKEYQKDANPFIYEQLQLIDTSHIQTFDSFTSDIVRQNHFLIGVSKEINNLDKQLETIKIEEFINEVIDDLFEQENKDIKLLADSYTLKNTDKIIDGVKNIIKNIELIVDYKEDYFLKFFNDHMVEQNLSLYDSVILKHIEKLEEVIETIGRVDDLVIDYSDKLAKHFDSILNIRGSLDYEEIYTICKKRKPASTSKIDEDIKTRLEIYKKVLKKECETICDLTSLPRESLKTEYVKTKPYVEAYLLITHEVLKKMAHYKKKINSYTYMDIAKFAVKIVKENPEVLNSFKNNTKEILVDEYQDTSDIQEELIQLIANNNLYLVGDVKQAIYRFRNANPLIFTEKLEQYGKGDGGVVIDLTYNFRSRNEVLENINQIFTGLMEKKFGGVDYEGNQKLSFGNVRYNSAPKPNNYQYELLTHDIKNEEIGYPNFTKHEVEAFIVGLDILNKMKTHQIFNLPTATYRTPTYKDFSIIVSNKAIYKTFENVFKYLGIPLIKSESSTFIRSEEVVFIKSVLECAYAVMHPEETTFDYKRSLLSILRSFVLEIDDTTIHEMYTNSNFELKNYLPELDKLLLKYAFSLDTKSLPEIINMIYNDFDIYYKLIKVGSVVEREKKLQYLYQKSFEFNQLSILDFIEYLNYIYKDANLDIDYNLPKSDADGVTIITIHGSKGLEYPICYFCDLDHRFNLTDTRDAVAVSNKFGIILKYPDLEFGLTDTFMKDLFKEKYIEEEISEKIRLFYVALTRAKEKFVIVSPIVKPRKLKDDFKSLYDILNYSLNETETFGKNFNLYEYKEFTKDYYYIKKKDNLPKVENKKEYKQINQEVEVINYTRASKKMLELSNNDALEVLELGTKFHNVLENISIKNAKLGYYDSYLEYNIVKNFLNSDFIKSLEIINEYHEYAYFDNLGHKSIIDLVLETNDKMYIIDYKLSDIDNPHYLEQLSKYKEYLQTITTKEIEIYLYSLFKKEFKKLN